MSHPMNHLRPWAIRSAFPFTPIPPGTSAANARFLSVWLFQGHPGHGHQGTRACVCPYCGHSGENNTFFTQEQIE